MNSFAFSTLLPTRSLLPAISRHFAIALSVVLLHVVFIYGLYSGLLMRAVELVVPVAVLSQLIEPPAPLQPPAPAPAPALSPPSQLAKAPPVKPAITKAPTVVAPLPIAINDPTPAVTAPTGALAPSQPAPAPVATPGIASLATQPGLAPAAPPAQASVQLPSSDADYLQNPKPAYPSISRRLNEQGKTVVRVLIGADGLPQRSEIARSSGFSRLDDAATTTVMRWRFIPGRRGGVAETMWFNVPIDWVLE